jgi:hypothetical protein
VSCLPPALLSATSTRVTCAMSIGASGAWNLAHRPRRLLRGVLALPAAGAGDEPARLSRARQRIMGRRRQCSHQPQTHAPPGSTHAPARRPSPPRLGVWRPAGPAISSIPGDFHTGVVRPGFRERSPSLLNHLIRPLEGRSMGIHIEAQWGHGCEGAGPAVTSRCQPGCNHFPSRRTNISVRRPRRVRSAPPDWNTTSKRP